MGRVATFFMQDDHQCITWETAESLVQRIQLAHERNQVHLEVMTFKWDDSVPVEPEQINMWLRTADFGDIWQRDYEEYRQNILKNMADAERERNAFAERMGLPVQETTPRLSV